MNNLPDELINIIFNDIFKITDKRQFIKTCSNYNNITKDNMSITINNFKVKNFLLMTNYCVQKFTLELCYDSYFDMIPKRYITKNNNLLVKSLSAFNCLKLLRVAKEMEINIDESCEYAAQYGHLNILKWCRKNAKTKHNPWVCYKAASSGHLKVLKWALKNGYSDSKWTYVAARSNRHVHITQWLDEKEYDFEH